MSDNKMHDRFEEFWKIYKLYNKEKLIEYLEQVGVIDNGKTVSDKIGEGIGLDNLSDAQLNKIIDELKSEDIDEIEDKNTSIDNLEVILEKGLKDKSQIKKIIDASIPNLDYYSFLMQLDKNDIAEYLTPDKIEEFGLSGSNITDLIISTGKVEEYLTPDIIFELDLLGVYIPDLIIATGNAEDYLTPDYVENLGLSILDLIYIIKAIGKAKDYLTPDYVEKFGLGNYEIERLIEATGNVEKYLFDDQLERYQESGSLNFNLSIANVIKVAENIEDYLTPDKIKEFGLSHYEIINLIKSTGKVENYLKPDKIKEFELNHYNITYLIKSTGKAENYLKPDKIKEFGLDNHDITDLIKATGKVENYLKPDKIKEFELSNNNIIDLLTYLSTNKEDSKWKSIGEMINKINKLPGLASQHNRFFQNFDFITSDKAKEQLQIYYEIFSNNNIPNFIKDFEYYYYVYSNIGNSNLKAISNLSKAEKNKTFFNSLFNIAINSNSKSLNDFCKILLNGRYSYENANNKILNDKEKAYLIQYRDSLLELYNINEQQKEEQLYINKSDNVINDINHIKEKLKIDENDNRPVDQMLLESIFDKATNKTKITPEAILKYMDNKLAQKMKQSLDVEEKILNGEMKIQPGDYIKGIRNFKDYSFSMLTEGVKAGEFNGKKSHSDLTPLDTDYSFINTENADEKSSINSSMSENYGNTWIVLKNYENKVKNNPSNKICLTKDQIVSTNSESYYLHKHGEYTLDRYLMVGNGSFDIDYIVSNEWTPTLGRVMAMAGVYIPVRDYETEKLIFTSNDYNKIRENEMAGLSYYGCNSISINENRNSVNQLKELYKKLCDSKVITDNKIDDTLQEIDNIMKGKEDVHTINKKAAVQEFLTNIIKEQGDYQISDEITRSLNPEIVELIDTGSTGRQTNVPGDADFDLMLKSSNNNLLRSAINNTISKECEYDKSKSVAGVSDITRFFDVVLPEEIRKKYNLTEKDLVDIDITYEENRIEFEYSSDLCVKDRMNSIKTQYGEVSDEFRAVKANIVMAKKILKGLGCYKKRGSKGATEYGGFGGIGVENWILQNGGSLTNALNSYVNTAKESTDYKDFISQYPIYDYGCNHRNVANSHDLFSSFLNDEKGFQHVQESFNKILEIEKSQQKETESGVEVKSREEWINKEQSVLEKSLNYDEFGKLTIDGRPLISVDFARMRALVSKYKEACYEKVSERVTGGEVRE